MARLDAPENRHPEVGESLGEHIQHVPTLVVVVLESTEQSQNNSGDGAECARPDELGEIAIDLTEANMAQILDEQQPVQWWQARSNGAGQLAEVATDEPSYGAPWNGNSRGRDRRVDGKHQGFRRGEESTYIGGDTVSAEASVNGDEARPGPDGGVQVRDVAESDERFGVGPKRVEVDVIRNAVRTCPSADSDDGPDLRVFDGLIEIGKAVLVTPSHEAPAVPGVATYANPEPPLSKLGNGVMELALGRRARRRHDGHGVA